jgi:uncharacterized lipoprotein YmbA
MTCWRLVLVVVGFAGCALTSKAAPIEMRYFSPPAHALTERVATANEARRAPMRLGRIEASALLGTKIIHRDSEVELAPYNTLRWADDPESYVRRALARALFEERPFAQATDGEAPTLDVEILAFEERRRGQRRYGRVELRYALRDDGRVIARGALAAEHVANGAGIERVVDAIGVALDEVADKVATRVVETTEEARSPEPRVRL